LEYIVPSEVTAALNDAIHELMLGWGFTRLSHGTMFKVQKSLAERADELQKKENPARSNSGSPS
jgi:hypothetical protein